MPVQNISNMHFVAGILQYVIPSHAASPSESQKCWFIQTDAPRKTADVNIIPHFCNITTQLSCRIAQHSRPQRRAAQTAHHFLISVTVLGVHLSCQPSSSLSRMSRSRSFRMVLGEGTLPLNLP